MDARDGSGCPSCGRALRSDGADTWCPQCALAAIIDDPGDGPVRFAPPGLTVHEELGRGAMGVVYRATQDEPARDVALKVLRPHEAASVESRARFRLEVATVAALDHPGVLPVHAAGEHEGLPYFTMKLCRDTLGARVARYRGRPRDAARLAAEVARAVHHAHTRGVLHRDLKPGNILFDEADRSFVGDFGLAKLLDGTGGEALTRPQLVMGTPGYLAPELVAGGAGAATIAADVYALGAILHELLTGVPPPAVGADAVPRPGVPRDLAVICAKALRPEPAARYASAESFASDLEAWLGGRPIAARAQSPVGRAWSWARRNPVVASLSAALCASLAIGAGLLVAKNRELRTALDGARAAEQRTQWALADSLVAQARAVRQSGREGQRREALALLQRAAAIRPTAEARSQAMAALLLPDWRRDERPSHWTGDTVTVTPTPDFSAMLVEEHSGRIYLRTRTGEDRWTWTAPAASASHPVFSADGRRVALRLRDDTVRVLAAADGRELLELRGRPYAFKGSVWLYGHDLDLSPDGSLLAATRPEGGVTIHALPGGEQVAEWVSPEWITSVRFSPDGARLAAAGSRERKDSLLAVIEAATGRELVRQKMPGRVEFASWSDDGQWLASRPVGGDTEVRAAADLALRTTVPDKDALHARFLADGDRLLLTRQIGETRLWDVARGQLLLSKHDAGRPGVWWRRDGMQQWRSFSAGPAVLQELGDSPVLRLSQPGDRTYTVPEMGWAMDRSAEGEYLAVGGWGGGMIWRAETGEPALRVMLTEESDTGMVRFDPDGGAVWVSLLKRGLARVPLTRRSNGGLAGGPAEAFDAEQGFFLAASNRPAGRLALVNRQSGEVKVVDTRARRVLSRWTHAAPGMAEFSPDGGQLVVNGTYQQQREGAPATVYDASTGLVVRTLGQAPGRIVRWSPGGTWVLAGEGKEAVRLWRTRDWSAGPLLPEGLLNWQTPAAFTADDRLLLGWAGGDYRMIEVATGQVVENFPLPAGTLFVLDVAVDGDRRFWSVEINGRIQVWDLGALRRELAAVGLAEAGGR